MADPTSGIIDNYNLRWNWGTSQLEMNTGGETWVVVPGAGTGAASAPATSIQFNDSGLLSGSANLTWVDASSALTLKGAASVINFENDADTDVEAYITKNESGGSFEIVNDPGEVLIESNGATIETSSIINLHSAEIFEYIGADGGGADGSIYMYAGATEYVATDHHEFDAKSGAAGVAMFVGEAAGLALSVYSTAGGFLPPVMTTTQRAAIASPAEGLVVYDVTMHELCLYNGTSWFTLDKTVIA